MNKSNELSIKNFCYSLLVVFVLIFLGLWLLFRPSDHIKQLRADLDERGVTTTAVIYDRKNVIKSRDLFFYKFEVDGTGYKGDFSGYMSWKLYAGDSVQIRYDPLDPTRNEWIKVPVERVIDGPLDWIIGIPLIILTCYFYWYTRTRD